MKEDSRAILKKYLLYITPARLSMLKIFLQTNEALTYNHFLNHPSFRADRITIFRTLKIFTDKQIIHRIPAPDGIKRYSLQQASENVHSNFMCIRCKRITPLKTIIPHKIKLPKGFRQKNIEIIIDGLCNICK